jgi:hypothetical protein
MRSRGVVVEATGKAMLLKIEEKTGNAILQNLDVDIFGGI